MKNTYIFILSIILCSFLLGCGSNLPENYGVYLYVKNSYVPIDAQNILYKGNLWQSIGGLYCPSGLGIEKADYFIIYLEGLKSESIQLTKLNFKRHGSVANITGKSNVEVNMWVASERIPFEIAPVVSKPNMYRLTPKTSLAEGFYAIHFGGLNESSTINAINGKMAYDFVVGHVSNYPSYDELRKQNEENLKEHALSLIDELNNLYNNNNFSEISNIYWPGGVKMTGNILETYKQESLIWFREAGKVKGYNIKESNFSEFHGIIIIKTDYETIGERTERISVRRIGKDFVLTTIE